MAWLSTVPVLWNEPTSQSASGAGAHSPAPTAGSFFGARRRCVSASRASVSRLLDAAAKASSNTLLLMGRPWAAP